MAKKTPDEFDGPWKDVLQMFLQPFLELLFPDIAADIDWTRGYESLDKELQRIARRAKVGKRLADKLFKIWLRDGRQRWLLVHIEIQREYDAAFAERMFQYNIAAYQMYNKEVISLAALCDDKPNWRPTSIAYGMWGCRTEVNFRIAKLLDFADRGAELEASENPIAAVIQAELGARGTEHDPAARMHKKLHLVRWLYRRNWPREQIVFLLALIDMMMGLPEEFSQAFDADVAALEEETDVKYVTSWERHGIQKGLEQGRAEGLAEGRIEGRIEGRKGVLEGIEIALDARFGASGLAIMPKVRRSREIADLRKFLRFLKKAQNIDEVRTYFE